MEWERKLHDARWAVVSWPERYGGRDACAARSGCATCTAPGRPARSGTAVASGVARRPDLAVMAPLAKLYCTDVLWRTAAEMVQLHGGIGFTWEHEAHRYLKRAKTSQLLLGTPGELRRLVGDLAGLR